jgi:ATP-dependent 26S proteasome regulatory subunit
VTAAATTAWQQANRRDLAARLAYLRGLLERALGRTPEPLTAQAYEPNPSLAVPRIAKLFGLSNFETELLVLCAAVELDSTIAGLCAELHGDPRRPRPSFGLAMTVLPGAHWSALTPAAPLRTWQLLTPSGGELLARSPLAIDERVLHLIAGVDELDARLSAVLSPLDPALHRSAPEHAGDLTAVARALAAGPLVELCGADRHTLIALGAAAAERAGLRPQLLRAADIPDELEQRRLLARLWEREALLGTNALLIELTDEARVIERASAFASLLSAPALLLSEQPLNIATLRPIVRHTLAPASAAEQQRIWGLALGPHTAALNGALPRLAAQFSLPPAAIHAATAEALSGQPAVGGDELAQRLWDACRQQARPRLDDLAQRIATQRRWDDIVLPERQLEMLREVTAHVAQRGRVYDQWGFGAELRGSGTSVIFAGGSGTGKTLAAEILANELRLDLYRVDLSGVVSKYIGETEKNLRRIFGAAEYGGAILLFDEADALFGKRSEVKDSHDRYANIEIDYLLQRIEGFTGLAILTTNLKSALDTAFTRRLRFVVDFPFPGTPEREAMWRRALPAEVPVEELDYGRLGRLGLTGGAIHNIALNAAFIAAQDGGVVRMPALLEATRMELRKLERPFHEAELR